MKIFLVWVFLILNITVAVQTQTIRNNLINRRCENPNNRTGTCVAIHDCQVLLLSERSFIEASRCGGGFGKIPYVCCASDTGFSRESGKETAAQTAEVKELNSNDSSWLRKIFTKNFIISKIWPEETGVLETRKSSYLPEPPTCGGEFVDNRIYGGRDTDSHEFPWMAFLEYSEVDPYQEAVCAGSLINPRYILTAAHCIQGPILRRKGELVAVRLGLRDYTQRSIFPEDSQRWRIIEKIVHENYKAKKTPLHDIGLLRLENNVRYSRTVRPICLPSELAAFNLKSDTKLTVAGWGSTEYASSSPVLQKVTVALMDQKFCKQQYGKLGLIIEPTHLCAGGAANRDSCRGDSGAPLMHYRNGIWVLEGVVSFGRRCGYRDWPGVYVRVSSYSQWINEKLRS